MLAMILINKHTKQSSHMTSTPMSDIPISKQIMLIDFSVCGGGGGGARLTGVDSLPPVGEDNQDGGQDKPGQLIAEYNAVFHLGRHSFRQSIHLPVYKDLNYPYSSLEFSG